MNTLRNVAALTIVLLLVGCGDSPTEPVAVCHEEVETVTSRINVEGEPWGFGSRRLAFLMDVIGADCRRVDTNIRQYVDNGTLYTILVGTWECTTCTGDG